MDKMRMETADLTQENVERIAELFPQVVTEALDVERSTPDHKVYKKVVNFEMLKQVLSEEALAGEEAYEFTWVGKKQAMAEVGRPIRKTLRPIVEDSVNFDTTKNIYIEGDNLDALKLLHESYRGKVKMIYIDPPYNTGNDFVYRDDFAMSKEDFDEGVGVYDEETGDRLFKNTQTNGRYHSDWCSMIYPRLVLARNLLTQDGVIFISIDDNEHINMKKICDEIFGALNFVTTLIDIRAEGGGLAKQAVIGHDYVIVYAKNIDIFSPLGRPKDIRGKVIRINDEEYWIETDWLRKEFGKYGTCPYEEIIQWLGEKKKIEIDQGLKEEKYVLVPKDGQHIVGRYRKVADDTSKFYTIIKHLNKNGIEDLAKLRLDKYFDFPKPVSLLKELILGATIKSKGKQEVILDFFSGSATTAHAVMQLNAEDGGNRRFIMVQLPEVTDEKSEAYKAGYKNICEIGKERIRRAGLKILQPLVTGAGRADGTGFGMGMPATKQDWDVITKEVLDIGFRVYRIDDSNMKDVYYSAGQYTQDLLSGLESNIKDDRTDLDLLYGCIVDWGLTLDLPHKSEVIDGITIYTVNDGDLVACFADNVPESVIKTIAKRQPLRAVFRDSSFANSPAKINVHEIFKLLAPNARVKVL